MRVLVTAGATREYIDDVRFVSNASTGKMGYAVARAFARRGHDVVLVSGVTALQPPTGVKCIVVESARDMRRAVLENLDGVDCVVMAAAVADYRPARRIRGKMKKSQSQLTLRLVRNPDILQEVSERKGDMLLVGFALESGAGTRNALLKMRKKKLDFVVLNAPSALGADRSTVTIFSADGEVIKLKDKPKSRIAAELVRLVSRKRKVGCSACR